MLNGQGEEIVDGKYEFIGVLGTPAIKSAHLKNSILNTLVMGKWKSPGGAALLLGIGRFKFGRLQLEKFSGLNRSWRI